MNRFVKWSAMLLFITLPARGGSPVELAGDLPQLLSSAKSPYLVVADVFVPVGKVVTIEPGTVMLFKNFTGVHVQGTLIADGSSLNPVILTSENDKDYNPQSKLAPTPYDWNGIYIHKDGLGTDLRNMKLMYSVKGIVSETKYIRITNCVFRENGRSNLVIEGEEKQVVAGASFSYNLSVKDVTADGVPIRILKDPEAAKRNLLRYVGLALAMGGAAAGGVFTYELSTSIKEVRSLSSLDTLNLTTKNSSDWKDARSRFNRNKALSIAGYCLVLIGVTGFSWSFKF
ncbi:MAG: hypothetical protein GX089_12325 [Fibrobacter sp.]|nr:hypothetical protein [Fibrobacter sp.]